MYILTNKTIFLAVRIQKKCYFSARRAALLYREYHLLYTVRKGFDISVFVTSGAGRYIANIDLCFRYIA
jgi:hypothetical protein